MEEQLLKLSVAFVMLGCGVYLIGFVFVQSQPSKIFLIIASSGFILASLRLIWKLF